jgi:hypothetical protein
MNDDLVLHLTPTDGRASKLNRVIDARSVTAAGVAVGAAVLRVVIGAQAFGTLLIGVALGAAVVAVALVMTRLRHHNSGLFIGNGQVGTIDAFGHRHGIPVQQVDHLYRCSVQLRNSNRAVPQLMFVDRGDRSLLRFDGADSLDPAGLDELSTRLGVPVRGNWDETYAFDEWVRRFPGAVARSTRAMAVMEERPKFGGLIGALVALAFFAILFAALLIRSHH